MRRSVRFLREGAGLRRVASLLLATTLLGPSAFALWAAIASYGAGVAARQASEVPDLLANARHAVGEQETLGLSYRIEANPAIRVRYGEQAIATTSALDQSILHASPDQALVIEQLRTAHERYLAAAEAMFGATDAGDLAAVLSNASKVAFQLSTLKGSMLAAIEDALAQEAVHDDRQQSIQRQVLVATPIVLTLDVALVAAFLVLRRVQDRRERHAAARDAAAVQRREHRFRALIQNASDVVLISAAADVITYQSPSAAIVWGYADEHLLGRPVQDLIHPDDRTAFQDLWGQICAASGSARNTEMRVQRQDGSWRHVELILTNLVHESAVEGIVVTARDIEERKAFERQLTQQAFCDALTGLPNRILLTDRIKQGLARASRRHRLIAVLFLDLDNFKLINDSLGHEAGDQLLVQAAARLSACVRAEDTVARLGGDEFVVLLDNLASEAAAAIVADAIAGQFRCPFRLDGREVVVTASIGVALGCPDQTDAESVLRNADVAMYRAKSNGKGQFVVFDASMHRDSLARLELENDLRRAVGNEEFCLHYQPIVDIESGRVVEVEALVRWHHPTRGLVAPGNFIPIAEETGIIVPLGRWVLDQACRQAAEWAISCPFNPPLTLSVNLSPRQFQQPDLDAEIAAVLQRTGLAPECLKLEITEGVIMQDVDRTIAMLSKLKTIGVKIAVDDFGTGYSSLAYLKRLPLDVLKIDQSFVNGLGRNPEDTAIVQAILSLAESLNLSVTGEGVETAEHAALLNRMKCSRGQGYFFARPLDVESATALLRTVRQPSTVFASLPDQEEMICPPAVL
ncbi:MAG TPA: EAL domain-containing protein [Acetobacteraceae bacterium]